ncbi:glycosyltransferase [Candidatus Parcubacteria bacterium]|nr:glycosyltransferase [Candidatus Parcubacteria bacterium]
MKINKYQTISVIMLNYNGLKYLERTVLSILNLNYANFEFIIVDNGSTDGSQEFIKKFDKIRLINSPRVREKNFACNYAIKRAKGKYIFLCDNDLLITDNNLLNNLYERYKQNSNVGLINIAFSDENNLKTKGYGNFQGYYFTKETNLIDCSLIYNFDNIEICHPSGIGIYFSKSFWENVGGYDDHLIFGGDDNDLGIKSWLFGYENRLYAKSIQLHIGLPERMNNKKYTLKYKETFYAQLYTIVKNYYFFNMVITIVGYSIFSFFKSIKQSLKRFHVGPFFAFFQGYYLFLINLPIAMKRRKEIQLKRVIKYDIFLNIKPPKLK